MGPLVVLSLPLNKSRRLPIPNPNSRCTSNTCLHLVFLLCVFCIYAFSISFLFFFSCPHCSFAFLTRELSPKKKLLKKRFENELKGVVVSSVTTIHTKNHQLVCEVLFTLDYPFARPYLQKYKYEPLTCLTHFLNQLYSTAITSIKYFSWVDSIPAINTR